MTYLNNWYFRSVGKLTIFFNTFYYEETSPDLGNGDNNRKKYLKNFQTIKKLIENLNVINDDKLESNKIKIPVCCDEKFSLDIKRLEEKLKISRDKIYEKFFNKEFFCYMTGFIAGMPFLGDLETELRAKRLETPRVKVPKGSVGLTEQFANVYTFESPGGWNIIGNTPSVIFDSSKENNPNLINPGDAVTFEQITKDQYNNYNE